MMEKLWMTNLVKLSDTRIDTLRMKEILINSKEILKEENFLEILMKTGKISQKEIDRVKKINIELQMKVLSDKEVSLLTFKDPDYPDNLKNLPDAPPILYCKGRLLPSDSNAVAIVGTRKATQYGLTVARNLAKELSRRGTIIISGLARGIDSQAHIGALEENGRTIAVMATGIDRVYPPGNKNLSVEIAEKGALLTELPPFSRPVPYYFPERNRIISGLSKAVIAVQASFKSGVFSTVRWALEYGRDVYALPGDITREVSKGTNKLLKMGAIPLTGYEDVLNNTKLMIEEKEIEPPPEIDNLGEDEKRVYELLELEPKTADMLTSEAKMKPQELLAVMAVLQIKGLAREIGGKRFVKDKI
jgi:DNA processing protein